MERSFRCFCLLAGLSFLLSGVLRADEIGEHGFAMSGDVRIHYVTAGEGPLVVLIHGFPDYWYTWRRQIPELSRHFKVVAIDQRGYNRSGQPDGIENYRMEKLLADVSAVLRHFERKKAVIVGHDWGGGVGWSYAMAHPEKVDRLVILNLPHLYGLQRELAENPRQQKASAYARLFQKPEAASTLTPEGLAGWVKDADARQKYVAAFRRSSMEGMLNYYKANYPREP
ncbi:MAG: alpha/beta hydrolase, partial [Planctomycetaceae bacterium]